MDERRQKLFDAGTKLAAHVKFTTGETIPEDEFNGILDRAEGILDKNADLNDEAGFTQAITDASLQIMENEMDKHATRNFDQTMAVFKVTVDKNAAMEGLGKSLSEYPVDLMAETMVKVAQLEEEAKLANNKTLETLAKLAESVEQLATMVQSAAGTTGDDIKPAGEAVTETTSAEVEKLIADAVAPNSLLEGAGDTSVTNPEMAGQGGIKPNAVPTLADTIANAKKIGRILSEALKKPAPATK